MNSKASRRLTLNRTGVYFQTLKECVLRAAVVVAFLHTAVAQETQHCIDLRVIRDLRRRTFDLPAFPMLLLLVMLLLLLLLSLLLLLRLLLLLVRLLLLLLSLLLLLRLLLLLVMLLLLLLLLLLL